MQGVAPSAIDLTLSAGKLEVTDWPTEDSGTSNDHLPIKFAIRLSPLKTSCVTHKFVNHHIYTNLMSASFASTVSTSREDRAQQTVSFLQNAVDPSILTVPAAV